tara:strand:+ start:133 stop:654 length:522 start_codon:yes stop_codon:yes gene_type:complete
MKNLKLILLIVIFFSISNFLNAKEIAFVSMQKILNDSKAGKKAQNTLKQQIADQNKKLEKEAQKLKKEEQDLISKKKTITPEEYKKSLNELRQKNANYQKEKRNINNELLRKKNEARKQLLKALNPILQKYMTDNNIEIIFDKKFVVMANKGTDMTNEILKLLDEQLKSIDLK